MFIFNIYCVNNLLQCETTICIKTMKYGDIHNALFYKDLVKKVT